LKIFLIVEGNSDKLLFLGQNEWFNTLGIETEIITTNGKQDMIKNAEKYYKISMLKKADYIIFLPDQNSDICAMKTRQKIGMDSQERAVTIVIKRALEAWILADGHCIQNSIQLDYSPAGQTDSILHPKNKLLSLLNRKLNHIPTTIEAINLVKSYFSFERASNNNQSAKRFKDFIENLSRG